jgi:hypothetical protein
LTENGNWLLRQLLASVAAAERSGEQQLREFGAAAGDDREVQSLFYESADSAKSHGQRIGMRLAELGATETSGGPDFVPATAAAPQIGRSAHISEEHLLHNLILASAMQAGKCALYKSLSAAASVAGDSATEVLAAELERNEQDTLERVRHFIPSRSKIAYNMLTLSEVDPAIETKAKDDRLES